MEIRVDDGSMNAKFSTPVILLEPSLTWVSKAVTWAAHVLSPTSQLGFAFGLVPVLREGMRVHRECFLSF